MKRSPILIRSRAARSKQGERSLALRKLLGRFNAVCDAVAFAHSRGILHRDIKPANVILGRFGETILADWGLAKKIGATDSDSFAGASREWQQRRNPHDRAGVGAGDASLYESRASPIGNRIHWAPPVTSTA